MSNLLYVVVDCVVPKEEDGVVVELVVEDEVVPGGVIVEDEVVTDAVTGVVVEDMVVVEETVVEVEHKTGLGLGIHSP